MHRGAFGLEVPVKVANRSTAPAGVVYIECGVSGPDGVLLGTGNGIVGDLQVGEVASTTVNVLDVPGAQGLTADCRATGS